MKPSPQVCQVKTISGRSFLFPRQWQNTVQRGSGETEQGRTHASVMSAGTVACLPTTRMQFFDLLGCTNGGMNAFIRDRAACTVAQREAGREGLAGRRLERNLDCSPPCKQLHVETSRTGRWWSTIKEAGALSAVSCFPLMKAVRFIPPIRFEKINKWGFFEICHCVFGFCWVDLTRRWQVLLFSTYEV